MSLLLWYAVVPFVGWCLGMGGLCMVIDWLMWPSESPDPSVRAPRAELPGAKVVRR